jgi:hypothetical protein
MLFYQFIVAREIPAEAFPEDEISEADVMVRVNGDLEESTNAAVLYLEDRGWKVTGVRHAQMAETIEEFQDSHRLLDLHEIATRDGIACAITAIHRFSNQEVAV